jgi:hypothetical protein
VRILASYSLAIYDHGGGNLASRVTEPTPQVFRFVPGTARPSSRSLRSRNQIGRRTMGKGLLLWLIGVPIPIILLLWLFFH